MSTENHLTRGNFMPRSPASTFHDFASVTKVTQVFDIHSNNLKSVPLLDEQKRMTTDHIVANNDLALSPIHRLPAELLNEIFIHCASMSDVVAEFLRNAVLVSSYWKSALLSFPRLWTTIDIDPTILLSIRKHQSFIQACLKNSKSLPLSVNISGASWNAMGPSLCSGYCSMLVPHIKRFQSCSAPVYFFSTLIRQCPPDIQFPLLRYLHVEGGQTKFSINAPNLFDLSFDSISPAMFDQDSIPWNQITVLKLGYCTSDTARKVLENTPNLVSLQLGISWVVGYNSNNKVPYQIILMHLKKLELLPAAPAAPVLGMLTAPQLESMTLYGHSLYEPVTQYVQEISAFLHRSSYPLKSLTLNHYHPAILTIIPELRNVEHLRCGFLNSSNDSLEDILPFVHSWIHGSRANLASRLRKLTLPVSWVQGQESLLKATVNLWDCSVDIEPEGRGSTSESQCRSYASIIIAIS